MSLCCFEFSVGGRAFVIGLSQISSFFSFNRESKTHLCASDKAGFLATRNMTCTIVGLALSYEKLLLSSWKQFVLIPVYQQILRIPIGTNCDPFIADLILYCFEMDFMSKLHKFKWYDLIDMIKDISRYLDDTLTIDNPEWRNIFLSYTQKNFGWTNQILQAKKHLPLI